MDEYVDRFAVLELLEERQKELCPVGMYRRNAVYGSDREKFDEWQDLIDAVKAIPDSDVAPVRHGTWEEVEVTDYLESNLMVASMFCPKCKRYHNEVYHYGNPTEMARYCGFCGAKMDAEEV